jgi:parvulin-like peptidyl-prolyl isomerase
LLRAFYTIVLCATLALLATMWLRPGIAQDLISLATGMRAQSPDPSAGPQMGAFQSMQFNNVPRAPMQPMAPTRPSTWPGAVADSPGIAPATNAAPNVNPYGPASGPPAGSGVTVWDPRGNYAVPPQTQTGGTMQNVPVVAAPGTAAPNGFNPPQNGYGAPPSGYSVPPNGYSVPQNNFNAPPGYAPPQGSFASPGPPVLDSQALPAPSGAAQLPSATVDQEVADAQVAAKVGSEIILVSDIKAFMQQVVELKGGGEIKPDQLEAVFQESARPILKHLVEMKLVSNDAIHTIPAEGLKKIQANINDDFDKKQLPEMMKHAKAATRQELEAQLRRSGRSLEWERRAYFETQLYYGWIQQQAKTEEAPPLGQVLSFYTEHHADYEFKAQAKWEELMVSFDRVSDKATAWAAIANMGLAVQQGQPFAEVAKAQSQGVTAYNGGAYDWTTQGSLAAKKIDEALFILPVNALSQIIETDRGFHIVRVVDRKPAGRKSFEDTQAEITKKLKDEDREKQIKKYLDGLREKTPIWTMFDNQPGGLDGPPKPPDEHFL